MTEFKTELLFQAITGPQPGESIKWWQLAYSRSVDDFADGAKSGSTLFIGTTDEGFSPKTDSNLTIGQNVKRIFGPLINNKWDPVELGLANPDDPIDPDPITSEDVALTKQFTIDVANTMTISELKIEGEDKEVSQVEFEDIPDSEGFRLGEGPFKFKVKPGNALETGLDPGKYTDAFSDGYWVGFDTSLLPSFPDGIDIDSKGTFALGSLPEVPDSNPLKETYYDFLRNEVGELTITQTYNFQFDLNEVTGSNKNNSLKGTAGRDKIEGGNGRDRLTGAGGNDYLDGGNGRDILNGTGPGLRNDGSGEIDVLRGGDGKDIFVLGQGSKTYYLGGGDSDYAIIEDFNTDDDLFRLGSRPCKYDLNEDYTIGGRDGVGISLHGDLVAIVVGELSADDLTPLADFVI